METASPTKASTARRKNKNGDRAVSETMIEIGGGKIATRLLVMRVKTISFWREAQVMELSVRGVVDANVQKLDTCFSARWHVQNNEKCPAGNRPVRPS